MRTPVYLKSGKYLTFEKISNMIKMEILAASAGSYPRIGDSVEQQRHRQAYAQLERGEITAEEFEQVQDEVTREVIEEQIRAGLDLITDGQVRWYDPISHLVRKVEGCRINGLLRYFDTNFYFRQPVVEGRLSRREPMLRGEFRFAKRVSARPVKPVLTGPYTLARHSIDRRGAGLKTIVSEFAEIIAEEVKDLVEEGAEIIQLDEPAILKHPDDFKLFRGAIETVSAERGGAQLALYTYFGDAAPLYEELLDLPVEAIGLDFTYGPKLPRVIEARGCDKDLGLGLIDGRNTRLERPEEILGKLKQILPALNSKRIYLNTSCGLGDYLPREIAFRKLQLVAEVAERAEELI
jgi:5-methyltetrahydropteroyltriglutamate--homocysteine methyltransferase